MSDLVIETSEPVAPILSEDAPILSEEAIYLSLKVEVPSEAVASATLIEEVIAKPTTVVPKPAFNYEELGEHYPSVPRSILEVP